MTGGWRKPRRCATTTCIEVSLDGDRVLVRDSKDADGPVLSFTYDEWSAFIAGIKNGEFE